MRINERQRKALARLAVSQDHCMPMDRILAKQLARKNLVRITEHVYERREWNEVMLRRAVVVLTDAGLVIAQLFAKP